MENKIFVTGSNGFVGKNLIPFLNKAGFHATAGTRELYGDFESFDGWEDLLKGHDCVVHLLARVHVMEETATNPLDAFRKINVESTYKFAQIAKKVGIKKFIFISSIKVNGEGTGQKPYSPEDVPHPLDPYGVSKMEAERELLKLNEPGVFDIIIIRPPLVYGKGVKANFLHLMKLVEKNIPLPFGGIKNKRSLVSVFNLCDLIVQTIKANNVAGEIFLVSDDVDYSLKDLILKMGNISNKRPILINIPVRLLEIGLVAVGKRSYIDRLFGNLHVDISKTKKLLNWSPKYSFEETFKL